MSTYERVEDARIVGADVSDVELTVHLEDGRTVTTPLDWYPRLAFGTPEERQQFEIVGHGYGVHWPILDEDLSIKGMLAGLPSGEGARCLAGWKGAMRERRRIQAEGKEPPPWGESPYQIPYSAFLKGDESTTHEERMPR